MANERTAGLHGPLTELRATLASEGQTPAEVPQGLKRALEAARRPACLLSLVRGGHEAQCWMDADAGALLVEEGDGQGRLLGLPAGVVTSAIADLCELGPRPRLEAKTSRPSVAGLARALAEPVQAESSLLAALGPDADRALVSALGALHAHWRVTSEWRHPDSSRIVEVIDTEAALFTVHPSGDRVDVAPSTAGEVWQALNALIPRSD